jgi:hypothetical protein
VIESNLASLVHLFGKPPNDMDASGQFMGWTTQSNWLALPADIAASGFYITNAFNTFTGNAAVGGWSGYAFPSLDAPVGLSRGVNLVPKNRPTLVFDGNSARSTGYWWGRAGVCRDSVRHDPELALRPEGPAATKERAAALAVAHGLVGITRALAHFMLPWTCRSTDRVQARSTLAVPSGTWTPAHRCFDTTRAGTWRADLWLLAFRCAPRASTRVSGTVLLP